MFGQISVLWLVLAVAAGLVAVGFMAVWVLMLKEHLKTMNVRLDTQSSMAMKLGLSNRELTVKLKAAEEEAEKGIAFLQRKLDEAKAGHETVQRQAALKYDAIKEQLVQASKTPASAAHDELWRKYRELEQKCERLETDCGVQRSYAEAMGKRLQTLTAAIRAHRDARGHDRCQENTLRLYRALGEDFDPNEVFALPHWSEWLPNCARYWLEEANLPDGHQITGSGPAYHLLMQTLYERSGGCRQASCPSGEPGVEGVTGSLPVSFVPSEIYAGTGGPCGVATVSTDLTVVPCPSRYPLFNEEGEHVGFNEPPG